MTVISKSDISVSGINTVNSISDISLIDDSVKLHSSDICVMWEDDNNNYFFPSGKSGEVFPWKQVVVDNAKNFDMLWPVKQMRDDRYGFSFLAKAGNYYSPEYVINNGDGFVRNDEQSSFLVWHQTGGMWYEHDMYLGDMVESYPLTVSIPDTTFTEYKLFVDSNDDVWNVTGYDRTTQQVTKLDKDTGGFKKFATRDEVVFSEESRGIQTWDVAQHGDVLHMVWQDVNTDVTNSWMVRGFYYSSFNMATGNWVVENEEINTLEDQNYTSTLYPQIVVRSDGEVVVTTGTGYLTYGTVTAQRYAWTRRLGANSWSTPAVIYPGYDDNAYSVTDTNTMALVVGHEDRVHFIYYKTHIDDSDRYIHSVSLESDNTLGTDAFAPRTGGLTQPYSEHRPNPIAITAGSTTYVYFLVGYYSGSNSNRDSIQVLFESSSNPTMSYHWNPDTGGGDDGTQTGDTWGEYGFLIASDDGLASLVRNERNRWYSPDGEYLSDGYGGKVYTQKVKGGDFDYYRQPLGADIPLAMNSSHNFGRIAYQAPSTQWEMDWPVLMQMGVGGLVKVDGVEYIYITLSNYQYHALARNGSAFILYPLKEIPILTEKHTSDALLLKTDSKQFFSDAVLFVEGDAPTVDYASDVNIVDRQSVYQTSDSQLLNRIAVSSTSDVFTVKTIILSVDMDTQFVTNVSVELLEVPPLGGRIIDRTAYLPGRSIRGKR